MLVCKNPNDCMCTLILLMQMSCIINAGKVHSTAVRGVLKPSITVDHVTGCAVFRS